MYNRHKTPYFKSNLSNISKEYTSTLNSSFNKYNTSKISKLRTFKHENPKLYWRTINNSTQRKNNQTEATLNDFYNFFQKINSENIEDQNTPEQQINPENESTQQNDNYEINVLITSEEITKAIKQLKNNKSPGADNIVNENIKSSKYHHVVHICQISKCNI